MKKILLFLLAGCWLLGCNAQTTPPNYQPDGKRTDVRALRAYETFTIPVGGATPSTISSKGYQWSGDIYLDSVNHRLYVLSGGSWRRMLSILDTANLVATTFQKILDRENARAYLNKPDTIDLNGNILSFKGTRTISFLPSGSLQLGNAGRISSNGNDTIKLTQATNDTNGVAIAARKYILYNNTNPTEITQSYLYAPQGDFLNIHASSQLNFETPNFSNNQVATWLLGAGAPFTFIGSGNSNEPNFFDLYNSDTTKLNNNVGIAFSVNRGMFLRTKVARIAGNISDSSYNSPDGELQFFTMKDSVLAKTMVIKGNGQMQLNKYPGSFTGTLVNNLGVDALGNVIPTVAVFEGAWTPTPTGIGNYSSSASLDGIYTRSGNTVSYSISGTVTATAGGSAVLFDLSLPIASNFTAQGDAKGAGAANFAGSNETIFVLANTANDRLALSVSIIGSTSARTFVVTGHYIIK